MARYRLIGIVEEVAAELIAEQPPASVHPSAPAR
jgi:hypothetical protein